MNINSHPKDGLSLPLDNEDFKHFVAKELSSLPAGFTGEQLKFIQYKMWSAYRRGFNDVKLMAKRGLPIKGLQHFDIDS